MNGWERPPEYDDEPDPPPEDTHWAERLGDWYYVGSVADQWDHIRHDVEPEDLAAEVAGMFLVRRDGTSEPAPTTHAGWEFLARTAEEDAVACVGRIVNGMCVPIGTEDDEPTPLEPTDVIGPPPADDREENELADRRHDLGGEGG